MSIAFHEWHRLVQDPSITNQIKDNLNTLIDQQLKSALETNHDIASMISYLTIDQLSLGSAAPVIELMDLGYPDVNEEEECTDHENQQQQQQQNNSNNDNRNSNNNMKKQSPPSIASSHQFQSKIWNKAMSTYSSSTSVFSQYLLPPSPSYSLPLTSTTTTTTTTGVVASASAPTTTLMDITTVPMIAIQHMKHLPSTTGSHIPVVVATGTTTTTTSTLANLKSLQREHLPSHICSFNTLYKRKRVVVRGGGGAIGAISGSTSAIGPTIVHRQSKRRSEWWKKRLNRMRQPRVTTTTTASKMKKISSSQKLSSISGSAHPHHYHPTTTTTTTTIPSSASSSSPLHIHDVNNQVTRFDLKVKQTHLTLPLHKDHTQETITENKKEEEPLLDLGYLLGVTTDQPESGLSLQLHVQYNGGDALLKLSTQLAVNFPCAQFLTVPIEITVSRLVFDAIICLTYKYNEETRTDQVSLYLKPYPNDDQSSSSSQQQQQPVLKDFGFDIKMGAPLAMKHDPNYVHDPNENAIFRDTLNVIEPFVRSTLQRTLNQFVFPNRIRVDHVLTRSETDESKKTKIHVAGHTFSL